MAVEQQHEPAACTRVDDDDITRAFRVLGKRWTGPIMSVLSNGPVYFVDLRKAVPGINERMLSDRLAELGAARLLVREVNEGPPLRVSYRLTKSDEALSPALRSLGQWAREHLPDGERSSRS
ncbi:winged helix-turn-helix transcriptional regulator [Streptomyces sp. NPDC003015]